jgi:hypothetical protein
MKTATHTKNSVSLALARLEWLCDELDKAMGVEQKAELARKKAAKAEAKRKGVAV